MPDMKLETVFAGSMPDPGWAPGALPDVAVALFLADDWRPWSGLAYGLLDDAERARVQRLRREEDRRRRALAYALHRLLLGAALGCEPAAVALSRDALGCPRLDGCSVHTSLSHADGYIGVAFGASGPLGVDIESVARAGSMLEIAGHVCHREEARALQGVEGQERALALLGLWVRKEAMLKAAGVGMAEDMDRFVAAPDRVLPLPSKPAEPTLVRMVDAGSSVLAAVACPPGVPLHTAWLRPGR